MVSIITVTFNAEKTIKATIDSVRRIKNEIIEYIVIDGLSTDRTNQIIQENMDIIDYYISEKDQGIYDAINKGIKLAHGEYTLFLAADDLIIPSAISNFLKTVSSETDIWSGSIISHNKYGYFNEKSEKNLEKLKRECSLRHPASFFKKCSFEKYGYYDSSLRCSGDREIFLRFYLKGAKFQIEDYPIEVFNEGGISTNNPTDLPVKEGIIIEKKYGLYNSNIKRANEKMFIKYKIKSTFIGKLILRIYYADLIYKCISKIDSGRNKKYSKKEIVQLLDSVKNEDEIAD